MKIALNSKCGKYKETKIRILQTYTIIVVVITSVVAVVVVCLFYKYFHCTEIVYKWLLRFWLVVEATPSRIQPELAYFFLFKGILWSQ